MDFSKRIAITGICLLLTTASYAQTDEGARNFNAANSSQVVKVQQSGSGFGGKAYTRSSGPVAAFFGKATATNGYTNGIWGVSNSPQGVGVRGESAGTGVVGSSTSDSGVGVYGTSPVTGVFGTSPISGVVGFATSNSGVGVTGNAGGGDSSGTSYGVGVVGHACNGSPCTQGFPIGINGINLAPVGAVAVFDTSARFNAAADLILGRQETDQFINVFRVDAGGNVFANSYKVGGADFAESIAVQGMKSLYSPGDVLVIDPNSERRLTRAAEPYSTLVAGIYSTKPGVLASPYKMGEAPETDVPLAVVGIVPCKVTAANGSIRAGDLLVTSTRPGYAMKGTDRNQMMGAVLGKALQPLAHGDGTIQVLVTLQ